MSAAGPPASGSRVGVLVAAGSGERLGADGPKAFVDLAGATLLERSARALAAAGVLDALVVVVPAGHERVAARLLDGVAPVRRVCAGGASRQDSVARGLRCLEPGDTIVAVHDAARALVTPALVAAVVRALDGPVAGVAPALPVVDTLKATDDDGRVLRTVDRAGLWAVQTPQVFVRAVLERAHAAAGGVADAPDDLALVERLGEQVRVVPGERRNLKITHPEDLTIAAALLAADAAPLVGEVGA